MAVQDKWPLMLDGSPFDGKNLWSLLREDTSPFKETWDVQLLVQEIEGVLRARVKDIPFVYHGSNSYGFHFQLEDHADVVARICRGDVNMPDYDGFTEEMLISKIRFEAAVYQLLQKSPAIRCAFLLHHRAPKSVDGPKTHIPENILGRHLLVFERTDGENNVWKCLSQSQRRYLLKQAATIRAELFRFELPQDFAATWLRERLFEQIPSNIPVSVGSTRNFTLSLFEAKIKATIRNLGDMIGWESDGNVVGPIAFSAKETLLRLIPLILPSEVVSEQDKPQLYRLVLDHGDFGIHNMQISMQKPNQPEVTSLYDWEMGSIVPAILSDPLMAVTVDLIADEKARATFTRKPPKYTDQDLQTFQSWSCEYFEELYRQAPDYQRAIMAGVDARHLWFSLRDWRGDDPETFFGDLGTWAENRIADLERV